MMNDNNDNQEQNGFENSFHPADAAEQQNGMPDKAAQDASASAENSMTVRFIIGTDEYVWKVPSNATFTAGNSHEWEITVTRTGVSGIQGTINPWLSGPCGSGNAL